MTETRPFWVVWVANKRCGCELNQDTFTTDIYYNAPRKRHYSEEDARKEAKRLANKFDVRTYVLKAIGYEESPPPEQPPTRWVDL